MLGDFIFWFSIPMLIDVVYTFFYLRYFYFRELKHRFIIFNKNVLPNDYISKLGIEYMQEQPPLQGTINFLYVPWSICLLFTSLWYIVIFNVFWEYFSNNLSSKKTYISPMKFSLDLVILGASYLITALYFANLITL